MRERLQEYVPVSRCYTKLTSSNKLLQTGTISHGQLMVLMVVVKCCQRAEFGLARLACDER
jgi:hypothetical protein